MDACVHNERICLKMRDCCLYGARARPRSVRPYTDSSAPCRGAMPFVKYPVEETHRLGRQSSYVSAHLIAQQGHSANNNGLTGSLLVSSARGKRVGPMDCEALYSASRSQWHG